MIQVYKNVSLALFFLMFPCLLVEEIIYMLGINIETGQWLIFTNLLLIALFSRNIVLIDFQKRLIYSLLLFLIITGIMIFLNSGGSINSLMYIIKKTLKNAVLAIIILIILNERRFKISSLLSFLVNIAFILSLFSIILYIGYLLNAINLKTVYIHSYNQYFQSAGILGYLNYTKEYLASGQLFRVQSFWTEPARFAQFLIIPTFILINKIVTKKNIFDIIKFLVLSIGIILTFSVACLYSLLIVCIFYFYIKKNKSSNKRVYLLKISNLFFIIIIIGTIGFFIFSSKYSYDDLAVPLGKGMQSIPFKIESIFDILKITLSNPFGVVSSYIEGHRQTALAFVYVLHYGGFLSLFALVMFLFKYYKELYVRIRRNSKYLFIYLGSISIFIMITWFGNYFQYYFIFQIMLVSTIIRNEVLNMPVFDRSVKNVVKP